jgi:hypothetical protein
MLKEHTVLKTGSVSIREQQMGSYQAHDNIVPTLLQQRKEHIASHLCCKFRAFLAYGYILKAWRQMKEMFMLKSEQCDYTELKSEKCDYTDAEASHPVSLSNPHFKLISYFNLFCKVDHVGQNMA